MSATRRVASGGGRPAFYAAGGGGLREAWTVLHPPYTAWHLSYVVLGASLAPAPDVGVLLATLAAFFLAVGVGAHALDELHGRPLATSIPGAVLAGAGGAGVGGALVLGGAGVTVVGLWLVPFIAAGALLVTAYDLELFGGRLHSDVGFAAAWGAFPVLTAYFAQAHTLGWPVVPAAAGAFGLSFAQRALSTPARSLRRRMVHLEGRVTFSDGQRVELDQAVLLLPLERALRALSWSVVAVATASAAARF